MNPEKIESLLSKADERLMLSCYGVDKALTDVRAKVYRKLKNKALDLGLNIIGIDGSSIAYNVRVISDKNGVKCDKRTLPKDLKTWIECPYEFDYYCEGLKHGEYSAIISYKVVVGSYEYPDECDLFLSVLRLSEVSK